MRLKSVSLLLCSAAMGGVAFAQNAQSSKGLEDVLVTAERRVQNIQKTPVAVTAISGAKLVQSGISDASGLVNLVPSVHASVSQTGTAIAIRGIVTNNPNPQGDPALSFNVDDVYYARTQATGGVFFDVNRIEVLRGPQGTTYGRNAVSGVINVITNNPVNHFAAEAAVEAGNYGLISGFAMINLPVNDVLSTRLAVDQVSHEGYISKHFDDADNFGQRFKALYHPGNDLSVLFSESYYHQGGHGTADVLYPYANARNPWQDSFYPLNYGTLNRSDVVLNARVEWSPDFANFVYLPSYQDFNEDNHSGQLGAISHDILKSRAYSQELRVSSKNDSNAAGHLQWVAGAFWFKETQNYSLNIVQPEIPLTDTPPYVIQDVGNWPLIGDQSEAIYAQATYNVTNALRFTGGLRYTVDRKSQDGTEAITIGGHTLNNVAYGGPSSNNVSYKAMVEYDITPQAMVYGGVTTGYHAGGEFDGQSPNNYYQPEKLTDYEVGLKSRWFENRLQINLDAYYYDYDNFQVGVVIPPFTIGETNAKQARLEGTELEGAFSLTPYDRITASADFEDTDYVDYFVSSIYSPTGGTPVPGGVSYNGEALPNIPRWSGTAGYEHTFPLANGATVVAGVSSYMRTNYWLSSTHTAVYHQDGYTDTNLNLAYNSPSAKWTVSAYVRNVENRPDLTSLGSAAGPNLYASLSPPRTFGARVDVKF